LKIETKFVKILINKVMIKYYIKKFIIVYFAIILLIGFSFCSSDTEGGGNKDAGEDAGLRTCKNSAQCNKNEECVNGLCVTKNPQDATADNIALDIEDADVVGEDIEITDSIPDVDILDGGDTLTDITDVEISTEYNIGIMSVYEGSAGECSNEEYILKSVSGYSGMGMMEGEEYTIMSGARFK
jgi:hypothetical protein